jgi:hypothetical protein
MVGTDQQIGDERRPAGREGREAKKAPRREGRRGAAARPGWGARMSALSIVNTGAPALFRPHCFYFRRAGPNLFATN